MKTSAVSIAFSVLAALTFPQSAFAQAPAAEFSGIQVVAQSYGDKNNALRPFQAFDDGVKVAFLIKHPAGGIIGLDLDKATIETFLDDKGTKLHTAGAFKNGFGSFPAVSQDAKAAVFTVEGTTPPAAGATKVTVKGSVMLKVASKKETVKGGAVTKGGKLTFKTLSMELKTVEQSGSDTRIEVQAPQNMDTIVEVRWLDATGKALEAEDGGRGSFGFGGKTTYSRSWTVKGTPASVEFTGWADLKTLTVPFETVAAIGATGAKASAK
jgi:hypothetical protein